MLNNSYDVNMFRLRDCVNRGILILYELGNNLNRLGSLQYSDWRLGTGMQHTDSYVMNTMSKIVFRNIFQ